jgi:protease-4
MIWREVELTKQEKPLVVSMGGLAASGGYYVSCGADRIFADETTVTGSIGVFGMLFNFGEFMEKHIGITSDFVQTHENAIAMSGLRPLSPYARDFINQEITEIYTTFKSRVAEGRGMSMEEVEAVAKGRVWTGKSALEIGLVDELGTLEDAKLHMKSLLELEDAEFKAFPEKKDPFEAFMESLQEDFSAKIWATYFSSPEAEALKRLNELKERDPIQARMPADIIIK